MNTRGQSRFKYYVSYWSAPYSQKLSLNRFCPENQVWWTDPHFLFTWKEGVIKLQDTANYSLLLLFCLGLDIGCQHWWKSGILLQLPKPNLTFSVVLSARANNRFTTSFLWLPGGRRNILDIVDVGTTAQQKLLPVVALLTCKKREKNQKTWTTATRTKKAKLFLLQSGYGLHQKWEKFVFWVRKRVTVLLLNKIMFLSGIRTLDSSI